MPAELKSLSLTRLMERYREFEAEVTRIERHKAQLEQASTDLESAKKRVAVVMKELKVRFSDG